MGLDTYEGALEYLFGATDYEKMQRVRYNADTFSLERMRRLSAALGSPERRFASIHVAGTKGKGSTSAVLHALALGCGLRAGLYTSPHLVDLRERIVVGREMIAREALRALVERARPEVERLRAAGPVVEGTSHYRAGDAPTFFEIFTALAFRHFADEAVDLAVVEVGLGGRLDATNILAPLASVITAVSLDHTHQLGTTLEQIAGEKAGIIKPGVALVCQPQPAEVLAVIERAAREAAAPLVLVGREVTYTWSPATPQVGIRLAVRTPHADYNDLFLPLMGEHQAVNAATAIAAAERAGPLEARLTPERVRRALAGVRWPGRMELLAGRPDMLLDGAHNRASLQRLLEGLAQHFPGRRLVFVFASAADKDVDGMLAVLVEKAGGAPVVLTKTQNPRASDPTDLAARFASHGGCGAETAPDTVSALAAARRRAPPDGLVVVCGSLYLVGEVKVHLAGPNGAGAE